MAVNTLSCKTELYGPIEWMKTSLSWIGFCIVPWTFFSELCTALNVTERCIFYYKMYIYRSKRALYQRDDFTAWNLRHEQSPGL